MRDTDIDNILQSLKSMAITKQQAINEDNPVVQQFWSNFDYMNTASFDGVLDTHRMNHSNDPEAEIAVNIEHYISKCYEQHLPMLSTADLRRYLPTSKSRKFVETRAVFSRLERKTVRCWIFKHA